MRPNSLLFALCASLLLASSSTAQNAFPIGTIPIRQVDGPELWVSGYNSGAVHRFDARTGMALGTIEDVQGAQSVRQREHDLFVVAEERNEVLRVRGSRVVGVFVGDDPNTAVNEAGPLNQPTAAVFGPDGHMYVASFANNRVLRYDGQTGAYIDTFVPRKDNGMTGPDAGMTWGPDGLLYIPAYVSNAVYRYDADGNFVDKFVTLANVRNPRMLLFRPSGNLWVSSEGSDEIVAFRPDGTPLGAVVSTNSPSGFAIGPHDGMLYVTSTSTNRVDRFDLLTGARESVFVKASAGLGAPTYLAFVGGR